MNLSRDRRVKNMVKDRTKRREKIVKELPGVFNKIEEEMSVLDAIRYCKAWTIHQKYLKGNGVSFADFPEEKEFQRFNEEFKFGTKAI
jgi:hypothetical protein